MKIILEKLPNLFVENICKSVVLQITNLMIYFMRQHVETVPFEKANAEQPVNFYKTKFRTYIVVIGEKDFPFAKKLYVRLLSIFDRLMVVYGLM